MIKDLTSLYLPSYPSVLVYMLQSTEYQEKPYLKWVWRTKDYTRVMHRRNLERTKAANLLLTALRIGILVEVALGLWLIYLGLFNDLPGGVVFGAAIILIYPFVWAHLLVVPLILGRWFISNPTNAKMVVESEKAFAEHPGIKVAVAGSYGKTTMKELLATVLSEGKKVAATPANKNVSVSHAKFANTLEGDEDILIIEYGEGEPGDVARFAKLTHPTHAVITGIAPAHLDKYKTLDAAAKDIFAIGDYVDGEHVYVNADSPAAKPYIKGSYQTFNHDGALSWKVSAVKVGLRGTEFTLKKAKKSIKLHSALVGRHQVGFLAFVSAFAMELGLTEKQVQAGITKTYPFEHRMQPYQLSGAWIIDDTYNGNLEGIRAGTQLLKELKAKRKIYVTPGLVDQGEETESVHIEVGRLIAEGKPSIVVLMENSVTQFIEKGLYEAGYKGELRLESDPLEFYSNLVHFVADGDLVVMQNDWTDNYA